jgi:hypothetical protein
MLDGCCIRSPIRNYTGTVREGRVTISVERRTSGHGIRRSQEAFCLEYLANGYNASKAYKASHPGCRSDGTARVEGHRLLTNPNIRQFLDEERRARNERLRLTGDEAMALLAMMARANIGDLYDEDGNLLPVPHWPDSVRRAVRSVRHGRTGTTVTMCDALRACELIAIATGRLGPPARVVPSIDHAAYLAGLDDPASTSQPPGRKRPA